MIKVYNDKCLLASVYTNDKELFDMLSSHHLAYRPNVRSENFNGNNCILSTVTIESVADDLKEKSMTARNAESVREYTIRCNALRSIQSFKGLIYLTHVSDDVFDQTVEYSGTKP